ncbi:hypothetical protein [Bradyrhizobium sp. USDA 4506]
MEQLHDLVHDGELAYIAVGRGRTCPRRRFTEQDLSDFIERRPAARAFELDRRRFFGAEKCSA